MSQERLTRDESRIRADEPRHCSDQFAGNRGFWDRVESDNSMQTMSAVYFTSGLIMDLFGGG